MPGHERFRGMLSIPYLGLGDEPKTLRFRCIQDHEHEYHGKYNSIKNDVPRMYNTRAIHKARAIPGSDIHVCEGELDAVVLGMIGLNAVAIPGANMWRRYHQRMLAGFSTVWMWADRDGALDDEKNAGENLLAKITDAVRQTRPVRLPAGDVGETYLQYGAETLLKLIEREDT